MQWVASRSMLVMDFCANAQQCATSAAGIYLVSCLLNVAHRGRNRIAASSSMVIDLSFNNLTSRLK